MSKLLVICHASISVATGVPEIAIDEEEGSALAKATTTLMQHFDLTPDPRTQAILGVAFAFGSVYAPRVIAYRARRAQEEREQPAGEGGAGIAGVYGPGGEPMGTTDFSNIQPGTFSPQ